MAAYEAWAPTDGTPGGRNQLGDVFGCAVTGAFRKTGDAGRFAAASGSACGEPAGNYRADSGEERNRSAAASGGTIPKPRASGRCGDLRSARPIGGRELQPGGKPSGAAAVHCDRPITGPGVRGVA